MHSRVRSGGVLILFALLLLHPAPATSQIAANGSVRGIARDPQGAILPGVVVTANSPDAPGTYTATTDGTGTYRLLDLPPGSYQLTARLDGFATLLQPDVVVRAGLNVGLDLTLALGNMSETVSVSGEPPMIESRTAATAVNISGTMQRSLPLARRNVWFDFLRLVPGTVNTKSASASALEFFYVNGAASGSHVIQLDGVDVAPGADSSNVYSYMSSEVLQDVQVKTTGIDASAPLGDGAVINMVTRSGTNVWHGGSALVIQGKQWNGNNNPGGTTSAYGIVQPDVTLGGPVRRDRIWLFGSYRYTTIRQGVSRTPQQLSAMQALAPGFSALDQDTRGSQLFAKATIQLRAAHRLTISDQFGTNAADALTALDTIKSKKSNYRGNTLSAIVDSTWRNDLVSKLSVSYNNLSNPGSLSITNTSSHVIAASVFPSQGALASTGTVAILGNNDPAAWQFAPAGKLTVSGDVTWTRSWLGLHELQGGFYLQPTRLYKFGAEFANDGFVTEGDVLIDPLQPAKGYIPYYKLVYDTTSFVTTDVNTSDYAGYVQDSWKVTEHLTAMVGARLDWIKSRDRGFNVTMKDTVAVGPRLGVNYSPTSSGHHAVRASFGLVHDAVSNSVGSAGLRSPGFTSFYDTDFNGSFETALVTPATTALTTSRIVDLDHYNQPYVRDVSVGYTAQWPRRITTDVSYLHRSFLDRMAQVAFNSQYQGQRFAGYADPSVNEIYRVQSNQWNAPVYDAASIQVSRESDIVRLLASYTRQFRHMSGTWQPNDPASFIQPDAFANDAGIGSVTAATQNSLSGTDMTGAAQWRDHVATAGASGRLPWDIVWGAAYSFQSGVWSGPIVMRLASGDPAFGPQTLTLSTGRVVQNPLATPIRFAYENRGAGQRHLPSVQALNLRLGRAFTVKGFKVDGAIDLLNALNGSSNYDFMTGANQQYNVNYGLGANLQTPRSARLSIRATF